MNILNPPTRSKGSLTWKMKTGISLVFGLVSTVGRFPPKKILFKAVLGMMNLIAELRLNFGQTDIF